MKDEDRDTPSLIASLENIWNNALGVGRDIFALFVLEIKLAGRSLAIILVMTVLTALLLLSTWFSLIAALVAWLMTLHFSLIVSLLMVSALNLFIAICIGLYVARISSNLQFKETRKQLEFMRNENETVTP